MTFVSCCCSFPSKLRLKLEKIKCKTMFFVTEIQENCSLLSGRKVVKEAFDILLHNYMQPVPRTQSSKKLLIFCCIITCNLCHVVDNMSSAKHAQVYKAYDCLIWLTPKSSNYKSVYNVDSISHKWRWNLIPSSKYEVVTCTQKRGQLWSWYWSKWYSENYHS